MVHDPGVPRGASPLHSGLDAAVVVLPSAPGGFTHPQVILRRTDGRMYTRALQGKTRHAVPVPTLPRLPRVHSQRLRGRRHASQRPHSNHPEQTVSQ